MKITYDHLVKFVMMSYCVLLFPLNLARLSGYGYVAVSILDAFLLTMAMLAVLRVVYLKGNVFADRVFVFSTIFLLLYISILGIMNNGINSIYGIRFYLLGFVVYFLLQKTNFYQNFVLSKRFWTFVLFVHVIGFVYYYIFLRGSVYPGIGVQSLGYASLNFAYFNSFFALLTSIVVAIAEQKRSVIVSLSVVLVILLISSSLKWRINFTRSVYLLLLGLFLINAILFVISFFDGQPIINRINLLNPYSSRFDIFLGSSGRFGELVSYFKNNSFRSLVVGQGIGFSYIWELGYANAQNGTIKEYFHTSIMNYVAVGGVVGLLYFLYLVSKVFVANSSRLNIPNTNLFLAFSMFSVLQSLFGFNTATDPIFWLALLGPSTLVNCEIADRVKEPS